MSGKVINMRTIKVCAGIGDNIWLLMKLINSGEQFHFQLPDGKPQRGKQIFDLMPQVAASATYVPGLSYKKLALQNIQKQFRNCSEIRLTEFSLSCNEHLEAGRRIENFFPDLPTSFLLPYQTSEEDKIKCYQLFGSANKYIGIYGSSYSTARAWGFWDEHGWFRLISLIHDYDPYYTFVIIGAEWDTDMAAKLMILLDEAGIPYVNTIGQLLGTVVEILKALQYFIGFPSGLSILNETLGKPGVMFYPPHLSKMINAWADPARIESGDYKGCLFCSPEQIFEWTVLNEKI